LPIDSLCIVAEDARQQAGGDATARFEVQVAMDARMDELYTGRYAWVDGAWQVLQAPALMRLPAFVQALATAPPTAAAGSALKAFAPRLPWPATTLLFPEEQDRAGALLRVAVQALREGRGVDAALALPLYLRDKVAQTTAERTAERARSRSLAVS
jgi:tRNA threonylcarbamoyladenosine biosynthesis protein TsaB